MWRRIKWVLKWLRRLLTAAFVLLLLAIGFVFAAAHTSWGREKLRAEAESRLQDAFPGGAKIGSVEGVPWGELTLRDVELDAKDGKPMVTIGRLTVELSMRALLDKTVRLERLEVDDVAIEIRQQAPEPDKPPEPPSPPSGPGWAFEVPRIQVDHARVRLADAASEPIEITDISLGASATRSSTGAVSGKIAVNGTWRKEPVLVTAVADYANDALSIPYATITAHGATVAALDAHVAEDALGGVLQIQVPRSTVAELAPSVPLPGDVLVMITGDGSHVAVQGSVGPANLFVSGHVDLDKRIVSALATVTSEDLFAATLGNVAGRGTVAVALEATPARVRGIIGANGAVEDPAESEAFVAFDLTRAMVKSAAPTVKAGEQKFTIDTWAAGTRAGVVHATAGAELTRQGEDVAVERARVDASGSNVENTRGRVAVHLDAHGKLLPILALSVEGYADGDRIAANGATVGEVHATITHALVAATTSGHVSLRATRVASGPVVLPSVRVDSDVWMRGAGAVNFDDIVHSIQTQVGTWSGSGGRITVDPDRIDARGLRTGTAGSSITVTAATYFPGTQDLVAALDVKQVALAAALPDAKGMVDGTIKVQRKSLAWSGGVHASARGVQIAGLQGELSKLPVDADLDVSLSGRRVKLTAHATNTSVGDVDLAATVDGPRDLADPLAWKRLDRRAIRTAQLDVPRFDSAPLGIPQATGTGTASLAITDGELRGEVHARGVTAGPEVLDGDLQIQPDGRDEIAATASVLLPANVRPRAIAHLEVPVRVFDPATWKAIDRRALQGAEIHLDDTQFDPQMAFAFGLDLPYRGRVSLTVDVAPAATSASFVADLGAASGGAILLPLDARVTGGIDPQGAHATAELGITGASGVLAQVEVSSPLTPNQVVAQQLAGVPVTGRLELLEVPAADLLAIIGRRDVMSGKVAASVTLTGTIDTPTGIAKASLVNIVVAPPVAGREPAKLTDLDATVVWTGTAGHIEVIGHEANGGELHAVADGRPDRAFDSLEATFDAKSFDLAPLTAFAPGQLAAATGTLTVPSLHYDPVAHRITGSGDIAKASLPLTNAIGTVYDAGVHFDIAGDTVHATVDGKLGSGTAHLTSTVMLQGPFPKTVDAKMTLAHVSPIGTIQPVIDADVAAKMARDATTGKWTGDVYVDNGVMNVSLKLRDELLVVGAPDDMIFVDAPPKPRTDKEIHVPRPEDAYVDINVHISPVQVEAHDHRAVSPVGDAHGVAEGTLRITYGEEGIGIEGRMFADRADVDLVGRRYDVEIAELAWDGPLYPLVNVRISHTFPDITLFVTIEGRAPDEMDVTPSYDGTGTYSRDQLIGFLFGGDPGGDPANAARDAATGAATAALSQLALNNEFARRLNRELPIKISTLRYSPSSATSSASVEIGSWLTPKLYVAYRQHLEALPTENINEGALEYYFVRRVLLDANAGDRQYDGADILYRLRW